MLLLLHALISCLAAYILPSSPVLLHIYCPHPLSCCIYVYCPHPLSCCIYTALVSLRFATVIPTSFNLLYNENVLLSFDNIVQNQDGFKGEKGEKGFAGPIGMNGKIVSRIILKVHEIQYLCT